jgi:hypothetical protein
MGALKRLAPTTDERAVMRYAHRCLFCGFQREAASPTIVLPHCNRCGAILEAVEADRSAPVAAKRREPTELVALGHRMAPAAVTAGALALMALAAAAGWRAAGVTVSIAAFGAALLAVSSLFRRAR